MVVPQKALPYHIWLEFDGFLLDVTTYQLRLKAEQLDAQDGGHTTIEWCPEYLFVQMKTISSLQAVVQKDTGMYYYERNQDIERRVVVTAPELDPEDVEKVWLLYHNPECIVFGPNDIPNDNTQ